MAWYQSSQILFRKRYHGSKITKSGTGTKTSILEAVCYGLAVRSVESNRVLPEACPVFGGNQNTWNFSVYHNQTNNILNQLN